MAQYVNTEAFFAWYHRVSREDAANEDQVLDQVFQQFVRTRKLEYRLDAEHSATGQDEVYPFTMEHLNCCGADTIILTF